MFQISFLGGQCVLDVEDLRKVINGQVTFRRCIDCDGCGNLYFDNRDDSRISSSRAEKIEREHLDIEGCDTCHGLGYVPSND